MNEKENQTPETTREVYSVGQVAALLRVDESTVRRWIGAGALPAITLPKLPGVTRERYRIRSSDVEQILITRAPDAPIRPFRERDG